MTTSSPTKAELHEMLAEAVRNTQPQPVNTQPGPRDVQPDPKRKSGSRNTRPAPKRTAKIKSVRASVRKRQPR
jgi:hypothetical protein